jgi:hypothetical protein
MFKKTLIALGLLAVGTGCIIVPPRPPMVLARMALPERLTLYIS